MSRVIFSKFCCHRRKKYQIETMIVQGDRDREVVKRAIDPEAVAHIKGLIQNENLLNSLYKENCMSKVAKCYKYDVNSVGFEYVKGVNFADIMEEVFEEGNTEKIIESLEAFYSLLLPMVNKESWEITDEFRQVFGNVVLYGNVASGNICNIDMIFSNIIKSEVYYITDYEWVFQFPIPINYIFYRSLLLSSGFSKLKNDIKLQVWEKFNIDQYQQDVYLEMEKRLQYYIVGEEFSIRCLNDKHLYKAVDFNSIPWENSGYIVRIYNIDGNEREELCSWISFDNQIKINLDLKKYHGVTQLAFSVASGNSIIMVDKVYGVAGECEVVLEYRHNAELKINDNLYFVKNEPLLYIENKGYDTIVLEYRIYKDGDSIVGNIVDYIQERQQFKEKAEFLSEYVGQLEKRNEDLRKELLQIGDERGKLLKELLQLGDERGKLSKELLQLGDERSRLSKELLQLGDERSRLSKELLQLGDERSRLSDELLRIGDENYLLKADNEYLKNLKVVKIYQRLKGKQ